MALQRTPANPEEDPGYPNSKEYSTQRRTFLTLIGAAAVAGLGGLLAYKTYASSEHQPPPIAFPKTQVEGDMPYVKPTTPLTAPQNVPQNVQPIAQPEIAAPGGVGPPQMEPVQPPIVKPPQPIAQPQVAPPGDVCIPLSEPLPPPVQPPPGQVPNVKPPQPLAHPEAAMPGKVAAPLAQPQSQPEGGVRAPEPLPLN